MDENNVIVKEFKELRRKMVMAVSSSMEGRHEETAFYLGYILKICEEAIEKYKNFELED